LYKIWKMLLVNTPSGQAFSNGFAMRVDNAPSYVACPSSFGGFSHIEPSLKQDSSNSPFAIEQPPVVHKVDGVLIGSCDSRLKYGDNIAVKLVLEYSQTPSHDGTLHARFSNSGRRGKPLIAKR